MTTTPMQTPPPRRRRRSSMAVAFKDALFSPTIKSETDASPPRRRRRSSLSAALKDAAFFPNVRAEMKGDTTQMFFEAKYYGPCPELSIEDASPDTSDLEDIMANRKAEGLVLRSNVHFTVDGMTLTEPKSKTVTFVWPTDSLAACATLKHPSIKFRQLGLLKLTSPVTGEVAWHLFKYYRNSAPDNMADAFQFLVEGNLEEMCKKAAEKDADERPQVTTAWGSTTTSTDGYLEVGVTNSTSGDAQISESTGYMEVNASQSSSSDTQMSKRTGHVEISQGSNPEVSSEVCPSSGYMDVNN
jgi:hypothetical protein